MSAECPLRTRPGLERTSRVRDHQAECFIRTLLHAWDYAQAYGGSLYRTRALSTYLRFYNTERHHTALDFLAPLQRPAAR
ncbi:MAG: hypothetical protein IT360_04220 [Gemmatimonadaceae bacterium]|nr:hypothetical protein [Gemmatimonadaceae bacterium]